MSFTLPTFPLVQTADRLVNQVQNNLKIFFGQLGQSISTIGTRVASQVINVSFPTSTAWGNLTSIQLSTGTWDISANILLLRNGASLNYADWGISAVSNPSLFPDAVEADNYLEFPAVFSGSTSDSSSSISTFRVSVLSGTPSYYLKYRSNYSSGTPQASARISAVRVD